MKNDNINYIKIIMALIVVGAFYILIGCPIKFLTGISCPGCGMTRAWISILKLDFSKAFYYHPLWITPPLFFFSYLFFKKKNEKLYNCILYFLFFAFILVYLIRLIGNSPIIKMEYEKGALYNFYKMFK